MKKAYVQTEIIKFLNKKEKEFGRPLNQQDVFNIISDLLSYLKENPDNEMDNISLEQFRQYMTVGLLQAQHGFQWV